MAGWTQYDKTPDPGAWGAWSGWSTAAQTKSDTKDVQSEVSYMYYCFLCPSCGRHEPYDGYCDCGYPLTYANFREVWSHTSYSASNSVRYNYCFGGTQKRYSTSIIPGEKWNFAESYLGSASAGVVDVYINRYITRMEYKYRTRVMNYKYKYYKWSDWSDWSDTVYTENETRKVESRTLYRQLVSQFSPIAPGEQPQGSVYHFSGDLSSIDLDLNGKLATIMVYKGWNTDPNEDQLQYVGQTTLGEGNTYEFDVIPKADPTPTTGDYTV